jgi:hypothetical protein
MIAFLVTVSLFLGVGLAVMKLADCRLPMTFVGRLAFVWLTGAATTGLVLYLCGLAGVPMAHWTILLLVIASAAMILVPRKASPREPPPAHRMLATVAMAIPLTVLLLSASIVPIRDYDGRATWLPKAKAIARDGVIDGPFFRGDAGLNLHNHYPLLIPLNAAAVMLLSDVDNESGRFFYVLMFIAGMLAMRDLLAAAFPRSSAWVIAAVAWLPLFVMVEGGALAAYNDVTLMVFTGIAMSLLLLFPASSTLAAVFAAALVLTKNEGLVLALAAVAPAVFLFPDRRTRIPVIASVAGAVVMGLLWKRMVPPAYDERYDVLIADLPAMLNRIPEAIGAIANSAINLQRWGLFWIAAAILALALLVARRRVVVAPLIVFLIGLAGYVAAFTVTSWDIAELAKVSADRLLMHLVMPAAMIVAAGLEAVAGGARSPSAPLRGQAD